MPRVMEPSGMLHATVAEPIHHALSSTWAIDATDAVPGWTFAVADAFA